ncbi:MAG: ribbon-helix-helix protein, CopG family [Burkholderiaceae bacterium]|nr:ribbon-helix-helix protein, CopG family [Burkholderiaceae bacterium]
MRPKSPMLTLRLDPQQETELEALAKRKGLTKSALIRQLIDQALTEQRHDPKAVVQSIMSMRESIRIKKPLNIRQLIEAGRD